MKLLMWPFHLKNLLPLAFGGYLAYRNHGSHPEWDLKQLATYGALWAAGAWLLLDTVISKATGKTTR